MFGTILEKILLEESVTQNNVIEAMKLHKCVTFNYNSTDGRGEHLGERFVVPFALGLTKAGNPVLRGFQISGDTTTEAPRWKFFRLDRIEKWRLTKAKFTKEQIDNFKSYGEANFDDDETMSGKPLMIVSFDGDDVKTPTVTDTSGVKLTVPKTETPLDKEKEDVVNNINTSQESGPKYKVGDVIPYKELLRRSADFRKNTQKNDLTKQANTLFKNGDLKTDNGNESGPKYKVGDVIPYKELLRRSADFRKDTQKNDLTKKANDMFRNGELDNNEKDPNFISASDQAKEQLSGLDQQLKNNPQKIDLNQFDKFEPTTNKKRW